MVERLRRRAESIVSGDPMDPATQMGPIAHRRAAGEDREAHRIGSRRRGPRRCRRRARPCRGASERLFHEPTILADVANDRAIAQEEIFGPVLAVIPFADEEGLSRSPTRRHTACRRRVDAQHQARPPRRQTARGRQRLGQPLPGRDLQLALRRYKASGIGRVNGIEALDEFLQTKSVWIELDEEIQDPFVLKL